MTLTPRRNADLLLVCLLGVLCGAGVVLIPDLVAKVLLAIPLCLLIPGYAIAQAIFGTSSLELAQRTLLSSALSMIALVLGGMLLDELPGGLNKGNWVGLTIALTLIASGVAWYRRGEHASATTAGGRAVTWRIPTVRPASAVVVILALAIAVGAVIASRRPESAKLANGYESVSLTPISGDRAVRVLLSSVRQHHASYKLEVSLDGRVVTQRTVSLKPGGEFQLSLALGRSSTPRQLRAAAVLTPGHWRPRVIRLQLPATS